MSGPGTQQFVPVPCPRGFGGYGDAHKLTCPTLRYEPPQTRIVSGKCDWCWRENGGEGCDWAMCGCACHDDMDEYEEVW